MIMGDSTTTPADAADDLPLIVRRLQEDTAAMRRQLPTVSKEDPQTTASRASMAERFQKDLSDALELYHTEKEGLHAGHDAARERVRAIKRNLAQSGDNRPLLTPRTSFAANDEQRASKRPGDAMTKTSAKRAMPAGNRSASSTANHGTRHPAAPEESPGRSGEVSRT